MAFVIAIGVIATLFLARRTGENAGTLSRFTDAWFLLLATQITLGTWVIWSNKAADIATTHVAVGATMFALGLALTAISWRLGAIGIRAADQPPARVSIEMPAR